jgi:small subunit ribosomal protein S8
MSMTDPIADFLTRIRNAGAARHATCEMGASRMKEELARILQAEGYIEGFDVSGEGTKRTLAVRLKYAPGGSSVIHGLKRYSSPGRRVYRGATDLPKMLGGLGISIVSTSRGIMTDAQARRQKVGGEVLCQVW